MSLFTFSSLAAAIEEVQMCVFSEVLGSAGGPASIFIQEFYTEIGESTTMSQLNLLLPPFQTMGY